jgi:hypothetical protein
MSGSSESEKNLSAFCNTSILFVLSYLISTIYCKINKLNSVERTISY